MRSLITALSDHDLLTLRVIGEWWDLELTGADKSRSVKEVAAALEGLDLEMELAYLAPEEAGAVHALAAAGGRIPVGSFSRTYGEVRQMGPGRLEREEPWLDPASTTEALWYRGFLFRGFDQDAESNTLVEYFYLPDELLAKLGPPASVEAAAAGQSLVVAEKPEVFDQATTSAVDDLATCLAMAQRAGLQSGAHEALVPFLYEAHPDRLRLLLTLAEESGYLRRGDGVLRPTRAAVDWLRQDREAQLRALADAWSASGWNDLCHTPGLRCEGSGWQNDPIAARTALLDHLPRDDNWYRLDDLVTLLRDSDPDLDRKSVV